MTIKVKCFSGVDNNLKFDWPTTMACRPEIGDGVKSYNGTVSHIVSITHSMVEIRYDGFPSPQYRTEPILLIELN